MISNINVYGIGAAVAASKYPMSNDIDSCTEEVTRRVESLAKTPIGEGHDNFLNGIIVQFDLCATNKFWTEFQRYHFFDFISSQSTMHRICRFDLDKAYIDFVDKRIVDIMKEKVNDYNSLDDKSTIEAKRKYLEILYSNPSGFKLTASITTNYRQLKTMYKQRKNHKLPEWRVFCEFIKSLPFGDWITDDDDINLSDVDCNLIYDDISKNILAVHYNLKNGGEAQNE